MKSHKNYHLLNDCDKLSSKFQKHFNAYHRLYIFVVLLFFIIVGLIFTSSYAIFQKEMAVKDFTIQVGELNYSIQSDKLTNQSITVLANSSVDLEIQITSLNDISSKYELLYNASDLTGIEVGYYVDTPDAVFGIIDKNGVKTIFLKVVNHGSVNKDITFLIEGGFDYNELEITKGNRITKEFERDVSVHGKVFASDNLGENCKTYDDGVDTFLVGQCSKNYVWYSGKLWRVVLKNNETGATKLVTENAITAISYNASGNTTFENSYVDQWLNQEFLPTLHDYEDYLVVNSTWNASLDASDTPSRPTNQTLVNRAVGLLNVYEYYTTYNQSDGLATSSTTYLNNDVYWWLLTPYDALDFRFIHTDYQWHTNKPTYNYGVRPSINLKSDIQISSGDGTVKNPYRLEGDSGEIVHGTTLLNTRYSGEYITFNNYLYRIVAIENGLTKITSVNKAPELAGSQFHSTDSTNLNFNNATLKTELENYYQNHIEGSYKAMIEPNTTWYLGTVGDGTSYKASICATVNASVNTADCVKTTVTSNATVGLPRLGEMFTSQIKREPEARGSFWTLTPCNASNPLVLHYLGLAYNNGNPVSGIGVRPSMYLKSNVVISSTNTGDGTYDSPYDIELRTSS